MPLGEGVPTNEREKEGHPLKNVILPLLTRLTSKWLQIGRHAAYHNKHWRRAS